MSTYVDDRTDEQRKTHIVGIAGTDRLLSGWGEAAGGTSVACRACKPDDVDRVRGWVESRKDMKRVREVELAKWRPRCVHAHIYVVDDDHQALQA